MKDSTWAPTGFEQAAYRSWPMRDEVALAMVRLCCEAVEDANPVYRDADIARASGFEGVIAPPSAAFCWCIPAEWSPVGEAFDLSAEVKNEPRGRSHPVSLRSVVANSRPLRLGERLIVHYFANPLSDPQHTKRGFGRLKVQHWALRDESGAQVSSVEIETVLPRVSEPGIGQEIPLAAMPQFEGTEAADPTNVEPGEVLPKLRMSASLKRNIKWIAASRDFTPVHHDSEFARRMGAHDLYFPMHFFYALVGRCITDWTGPSGFLERMEFEHWGRCFPGETALVEGRVVAVNREPSGEVVRLEIAAGCERGKLYDAFATVRIGRCGDSRS
jgi:acyl dehydratase